MMEASHYQVPSANTPLSAVLLRKPCGEQAGSPPAKSLTRSIPQKPVPFIHSPVSVLFPLNFARLSHMMLHSFHEAVKPPRP